MSSQWRTDIVFQKEILEEHQKYNLGEKSKLKCKTRELLKRQLLEILQAPPGLNMHIVQAVHGLSISKPLTAPSAAFVAE